MGKIINFLIYHYVPSLGWNATFLAIFALSAIVHSYQAYRSRFWIFFPTLVLGALVEVMGYAGRVWSNKSVFELTPYLMQIVLLGFAPVYFSAFVYVVLGMAINRLGQQYSILTPRLYFLTFITADILSLILQAVGGGSAASGAATGLPMQWATDTMVAGICFQLITMSIFLGCGIDFAIRVSRDKPWGFRLRQIEARRNVTLTPEVSGGSDRSSAVDAEKDAGAAIVDVKGDLRQWRWIIAATLLSSMMIILRGFFRAVELSQGWSGYLISREIYQAVLDGIPMVIAVGIFNFIHPGLILGRKELWRGYY